MNYNSGSPLHFIPIGRAIVDPVELATATSLAIFGKRSADTAVMEDGNGDIVLLFPSPRSGERDTSGQDYKAALLHGAERITKAMRAGELEAFVISEDGRYLRVPRLYWLQANPTTITALIQTGHIADNLVGAPLLVDPAHLDNWRQIVAPVVQEALAQTGGIPIDKAEPARRSASRPGPDPYKEYPMLAVVFNSHHEKLSNCTSDRARHRYLTAIWSLVAAKANRDTCPSKAVVQRCWERWVTTPH